MRPLFEAKSIDRTRDEVISLLAGLRSAGKTIAGFGAPAKATTLMYHFGLGPDVFDFIIDDNPSKQGKYLPHSHIPIISPKMLEQASPEHVLVLPWNLIPELTLQLSQYNLVTALPELRFLPTS